MENVNNYMRNHIKTIHDTSKRILNGKVGSEDFYCSMVFRGIHEEKFDSGSVLAFLNMSEKDKLESILFQGLMEAVMLEDLYIALNKKVATGKASDADLKLINRIITCANKDKDDMYESLFIDPNIGTKLVQASLGFLASSAYEKVLSFKCLDTDDAIVLTSISPYFTQDLKRYSLDINRDFLITQINRWKDITTEDESINAAAEFLITAFNMDIDIETLVVDIINHAESEDVMQALVDENIELLSSFILAYYRTYNQEGPKL